MTRRPFFSFWSLNLMTGASAIAGTAQTAARNTGNRARLDGRSIVPPLKRERLGIEGEPRGPHRAILGGLEPVYKSYEGASPGAGHLDAGGEIGRKPASGCLRISAPIGAIMAEKASERGRNAKHPAKVLTFESMDRRRRIPAPSPAIRPRSEAFPAFSSLSSRLPVLRYARTLMTTRRFCEQPSLVLFGAIGFSSP